MGNLGDSWFIFGTKGVPQGYAWESYNRASWNRFYENFGDSGSKYCQLEAFVRIHLVTFGMFFVSRCFSVVFFILAGAGGRGGLC